MTVLSVITYFCERSGLPVPATVFGSTDTQLKQIRAILEEEGNDLSSRGAWERITFEATLTSLAAEDQGAITSIATNGFKYIKNETIWDRTDQIPILGPMSAAEWQASKALITTGPRFRYRIRGGHLLVNPTPTAGHDWRFEYVSKNWILDSDGSTYKQYFDADDDTILLPEELVLMGLRWRYKKEKGFDYAEDFRTYEMQVKDALGRDGAKPRISMEGRDTNGPRPGIFVPQGSWSIP